MNPLSHSDIIDFIKEIDNTNNQKLNMYGIEVCAWSLVRHLIWHILRTYGQLDNSINISKSSYLHPIVLNSLKSFRKLENENIYFSNNPTYSKFVKESEFTIINNGYKNGNPLLSYKLYKYYLIKRNVRNNENLKNFSKDINSLIWAKFNIKIDVFPIYVEKISLFLYSYKVFDKIFTKSNIHKIYVAPYTSNEFFSKLAEKYGFEVIEVQHGAIDVNHISYSYGEKPKNIYLPSKLLLWDEYWQKGVSKNIKTEVVGYDIPKIYDFLYYNFLFISQYDISEKMIDVAIKICNDNPTKKIALKLHPMETFPKNKLPDNLDVFGTEITLDHIIAISENVYGSHSTGVYEALKKQKKVYVLKETCILDIYLEDPNIIKV